MTQPTQFRGLSKERGEESGGGEGGGAGWAERRSLTEAFVLKRRVRWRGVGVRSGGRGGGAGDYGQGRLVTGGL